VASAPTGIGLERASANFYRCAVMDLYAIIHLIADTGRCANCAVRPSELTRDGLVFACARRYERGGRLPRRLS
jgi:hypothetical protein